MMKMMRHKERNIDQGKGLLLTINLYCVHCLQQDVDPDLYMQCYVSYLFNVMYHIYSSSPTFSTQEQKKQKSREWQRAYRQKIKNSIHGAE